jgi:hypothetical protein
VISGDPPILGVLSAEQRRLLDLSLRFWRAYFGAWTNNLKRDADEEV